MHRIPDPDPTVDMLGKLLTLHDSDPSFFSTKDSATLIHISDARAVGAVVGDEKIALQRLWDEYAARPL